METKKLVRTLFTQEGCKSCDICLWGRVNCDEATDHTPIVLGEKHEHYRCLNSDCIVTGYKLEIYKLN